MGPGPIPVLALVYWRPASEQLQLGRQPWHEAVCYGGVMGLALGATGLGSSPAVTTSRLGTLHMTLKTLPSFPHFKNEDNNSIYPCINHAFVCVCFMMLWHLGVLQTQGGTVSPRTS